MKFRVPFYTAFVERKEQREVDRQAHRRHVSRMGRDMLANVRALTKRIGKIDRHVHRHCDSFKKVGVDMAEAYDLIEKLRGCVNHNDDNFYESIRKLKDDIKKLDACKDCLCESKADDVELYAVKEDVANIREKHGTTLWKLKKSVKGLGELFQRVKPLELQVGRNQFAVNENVNDLAMLSTAVGSIVTRLEHLETVMKLVDKSTDRLLGDVKNTDMDRRVLAALLEKMNVNIVYDESGKVTIADADQQ